ncbi:MAG: FecR domain-containing protein [Sphingobacteriales bacterium]|nr:FecR domain-containing protein [Sphingobacteriales bacterium]OJY80805.1 MAG: hypothetical protein BGP14_00980 [Sphingobacteriales bacterium 44-15]
MQHIPDHIKALIQKCLDGTSTPEEKRMLDEWYYNFSPEDPGFLSDETEAAIGRRIKSRLDEYVLHETGRHRSRKRSGFIRAAVILSVTGVALLLYYITAGRGEREKIVQETAAAAPVTDIIPGSNKAILTLGDGSTMVLDTASNGQVGTQGNIKVIKLNSGQLKYLKGKQGQMTGGTIYNTISTPKGGQYQVVLADGSKIWLNASSSLRFPTEFRDKIREVEVTGEAYCEIVHNASKPFRLKVKEMQVNVLGTHFDVMAYDNENAIKTTLLEGSLRVSNATGASLITPGQQAVLHKNGSFQLVSNADVEEAVAWKNGKFVFNSADIHTIMRQIERWYDVDISFEREADLHFTGQLSRYINVSELLRKLELTNEVHFRIEKGKITVLP